MEKISVAGFFIALFCIAPAQRALAHEGKKLLTVAESSGFSATSRYEDVIRFIRTLQGRSEFIRVESMGLSTEGREIPLVILGAPPPSSPEDLRYDDRAVVYLQANIHAGEVEGKEALLMLMRHILQQDKPPYLDDLIILVCPIFNADGNDKISRLNRKNQAGPQKGVGVRYNGQELDLNRDSMKMESPELRALVENVLRRWDPLLVVDCHTTNGSHHLEPVTYSWPLNPNGDAEILRYQRDEMMPALRAHLFAKHKTMSIPYGNFTGEQEVTGWATFSHMPRFLTNYIGLRNRLSILVENYAHASYKTRVLGNYRYLLSILDYCRDHRQELTRLVRDADARAARRGGNPTEADAFTVEYELEPLKDPVTISSWEMEPNKKGSYPRFIKAKKKRTYEIPYFADFAVKRTVRFPFAYLISAQAPGIVDKLMQHGIVVERLEKAITAEVQAFKIEEITSDQTLYQGHRMTRVKGNYGPEKKRFLPGAVCIRTAQPLGSLIAYLLEPESDDGLLAWNFFDRYLVSQWYLELQTYPVYKLLEPVRLVTTRVPSN